MTDLELAQIERTIRDDTAATTIRIKAQYCGLCGTRLENGKCPHRCGDADKERELGEFYASTINPRTCPLCGGAIRPDADKMTGRWWNEPSHNQVWLCGECSFAGTFRDFADEADRLLVTMPDYESVPA